MKNLFKFREFDYKYITIYLFQKSRWSIGFCLDVDYEEGIAGGYTGKDIKGRKLTYDWSTWLFSIDLIFIYIELHNSQD